MQNDVTFSFDKIELLSIGLELLMESNGIPVQCYSIKDDYSSEAITEAKTLIKEVETLIINNGTDIHTVGNVWVNSSFCGPTKTIKYLLSKQYDNRLKCIIFEESNQI